ncbi:MAG: B12-binding domain-containing radical SAM protein [Elusimicrobiota bacterium]
MGKRKKILLVYPRYPSSFWSLRYALEFISKKASHPPLGLLTISNLLPHDWNKKLIDLNVKSLSDKYLDWADMVFLSGMTIQKESAKEVIKRCQKKSVRLVAGGPMFTTGYKEFSGIDHYILNEAEITLPRFLNDLSKGSPRKFYSTDKWCDMRSSPVPDWDLINKKDYATMNIQFSRGCPYNCEFCDITQLFGHKIRRKSVGQIINELETIYKTGWTENIFFVDDNFIAHRRFLKEKLLPAIIKWSKERNYPFTFNTQASIDMADDKKLMNLMTEAGFDTVFIGIESPNEESLAECTKSQNQGRDMLNSVKTIQKHGLIVQGGFIVGFDSDPQSIFEAQIKFIQESGIATAMVGLLNALRGTQLYRRLKEEGRLIVDKNSGDNTNFSMNFIPRMDTEKLKRGYKKIVSTIYSPRNYYLRVKNFLKIYNPKTRVKNKFKWHHIMAFIKSIFKLGILEKERIYYWNLLIWTLIKKPRTFPTAVTLSIYGFHFRKVFEKYNI